MLFKGLFQLLRLASNSAVFAANRDQAPATIEKILCRPLVLRAILHPFVHPLMFSPLGDSSQNTFGLVCHDRGHRVDKVEVLRLHDDSRLGGCIASFCLQEQLASNGQSAQLCCLVPGVCCKKKW